MSSRSANNNNNVTINPDGFVETDSTLEIITSFDEMSLNMDLLRGIYAYGWEQPTAIQQRAVKPMMNGRDTLAQAQSGTGKTGAFSVGALSCVDCSRKSVQVVIFSPTRELATQTYDVIRDVGMYMEGLTVVRCVGGVAVRDNIRDLRGPSQICVGTPGRLLHMMNGGNLNVESLKMLVLDEADEMLDRGFREQIYEAFHYVPQEVQVCLFSATYDDEVMETCKRFMRDPVKILVKQEALTLEGIKQYFVNCEREEHKLDTLCDLYEHISVAQLIIFCNTQVRTDWLQSNLENRDFTCSRIHGGMTTQERAYEMKLFRTGTTRVLISTDLLARGIDVANVGMVINYDLPHRDHANYLHRIGRSGRHGKKGVSINFMTNGHQDLTTHNDLQRYYSTKINELPEDIAALET